jgi:hypothetical protein
MKITLSKSLAFSLIGILSIPAIAFASLQALYPSDPDHIYTKHGELTMEWIKFAEADNFTEYLSKEKVFDEDTMVTEFLVLRNYKEPQNIIHEHSNLIYSSMVIHQNVNCWSSTVSIEDIILFSKKFSKGPIVRDLYDLDYEIGEAKPDTIDDKKVKTMCHFST